MSAFHEVHLGDVVKCLRWDSGSGNVVNVDKNTGPGAGGAQWPFKVEWHDKALGIGWYSADELDVIEPVNATAFAKWVDGGDPFAWDEETPHYEYRMGDIIDDDDGQCEDEFKKGDRVKILAAPAGTSLDRWVGTEGTVVSDHHEEGDVRVHADEDSDPDRKFWYPIRDLELTHRPDDAWRRGPLMTAHNLVHGPRGRDYDHPYVDYLRTADIFRAMTGVELTVTQAVKFMIAVKLSRDEASPHVEDHLVDAAGYIECLSMVRKREAILSEGGF